MVLIDIESSLYRLDACPRPIYRLEAGSKKKRTEVNDVVGGRHCLIAAYKKGDASCCCDLGCIHIFRMPTSIVNLIFVQLLSYFVVVTYVGFFFFPRLLITSLC